MGNNKDKLVAAVGIILIAIVAGFTFTRPIWQKGKAVEKIIPEAKEQYSFISVSDFEEQQRNKSDLIILDSRPPSAFNQEHIVGSVNARNENINQYLDKINPAGKIVLVGADSNDLSVKLLAETLKVKNYKNFSILSGGIAAWIDSGNRTIRLGNPGSFSDQAKINIIKPEELKNLLENKDSRLYILDLRSSKSYAAEHLPQAQNIPGDNLEEKFNSIPAGKNIVFYSNSELESFQYGVILFDLGFSRSSALEGGVEGWKQKSYPTEK